MQEGRHCLMAAVFAKRRSLQRMRRVVEACQAAVQSEFPRFDVILAFTCFSLKECGGTCSAAFMSDVVAGTRQPALQRDSFERLSLVFGMPVDTFSVQFERLRSVAMVRLKASSCSQREAWQFAWRRCKGQWEVNAVEPVLAAYLCWTGSHLLVWNRTLAK